MGYRSRRGDQEGKQRGIKVEYKEGETKNGGKPRMGSQEPRPRIGNQEGGTNKGKQKSRKQVWGRTDQDVETEKGEQRTGNQEWGIENGQLRRRGNK